jgi:outer membrane receptor protein involved in Fe transport
MLSYRFKAANRDWNAQLNVKNLTSTVYRDNADGFIAEPRRFYLSLGTRF